MLAIALDLPPLPINGAALTTMQMQGMAPLDRERAGFDLATYCYMPGSAVTADPVLGDVAAEPAEAYEPKTPLGRRLLALRKSYLDQGGKLLSPEELDVELEARRGGLGDV